MSTTWQPFGNVSAAFGRALRGMAGVGVVALYAYVVVTAGPGNGVQPAAGAPQLAQVTLPTVTIVGRRETKLAGTAATQQAGSAATVSTGRVVLTSGQRGAVAW